MRHMAVLVIMMLGFGFSMLVEDDLRILLHYYTSITNNKMCQIVDSWTEEPKVVSINRQILFSLQKAFFFLENRRKVEKHGLRSLLLWDLATMLLVGIITIPPLITSMDSTYSRVFNRELCYHSVVAWVNLVN